MPYRAVASPPPPTEADLDTPEMIEAARAAERDERNILVLSEVIEIGMRLMRAQEAYAAARLAKVAADGSALNPGENPTAAYDKLAQTVRRTFALSKQLGEEVKTRRTGLLCERAARRAKRTEDHKVAVRDEIENALVDAFEADLILPEFDPEADPYKPEPYEIERREMLDDAEMLLGDFEAFRDYLSRPVGETVAMLCVALGIESGGCYQNGDTWLVRRSKTAFEAKREAKRASLPPTCGEGQTAKPSEWGVAGKPHAPEAAAPHPGRPATCPSP